MALIKIRNKTIGKKTIFIIAEVGINHNGSLVECKKLIRKAKYSGADAVKLQIINPEESYSNHTESYKIFKKNELNLNEIIKVRNFANKLGIILFATPGDFTSIKLIKKLKFPAIKISSGLLTNTPLILECAKLKKPIIISTGFAKIKDIQEAVNTIKKYHNKIIILKCTSIYPAPNKYLNLSSINTLKNKFKEYIIGYSDHSLGDTACIVAASIGSKVIEKHFTLDNKQKGADHKISSTPNEFLKLVKKIRNVEDSLGRENVFPTNYENKLRKFYHRTIVANRNINKNEIFTIENISLKRTNTTGKRLHPKYYFKIIGKISKKNIKKDELIKLDYLK